MIPFLKKNKDAKMPARAENKGNERKRTVNKKPFFTSFPLYMLNVPNGLNSTPNRKDVPLE